MKLNKNIFLLLSYVLCLPLILCGYAEFELKEDAKTIGDKFSELLIQCRNESLSTFAVKEKEILEDVKDFYNATHSRTQGSCCRYAEEQIFSKYLPSIKECDETKTSSNVYAEDYFEAQDDKEKTLFYALLVNTIKEIKQDLQNSHKALSDL